MKVNWWNILSEVLRILAAAISGAAGGAVMTM